ncbi:MAG: hypothetical protein J7K83_01200 [Candidatus Aenigmarchaeota archaeon]|nr:hypothetical protein [Candidatus Aenigmarchaeota archaeon]
MSRKSADRMVLALINRDYWLSGRAEAGEGDPLAGVENNEMLNKVTVARTARELWKYIENYAGTFKYKNFYFANHPAYGCFVYVVKGGRAKQFEHISFSRFESFRRWLNKMMRIYRKTRSVDDFVETYFA